MKTEYDIESLKFISDHLSINLEPEEFVEIRTISSNGAVMHGAFRDPDAIVSLAQNLSGKTNVYFGLNPRKKISLNPGEKIDGGIHTGKTYGAGSVSRICHFLIDLDRRVKAKDIGGKVIPATHEELKYIRSIADQVSQFLISYGRKVPHAIFESGNGIHILIQTVNYDPVEAPLKFKKILESLEDWFGTDDVEIDTSTHDAPRICKLYGTKSLKGQGDQAKQNRISKFVSGSLEPVDIFSELDDALKFKVQPTESTQVDFKPYSGQHLPIADIFRKHGLYEKSLSKGRHIVTCPYRSMHGSNTDASSTTVIFDGSGGKFGFKCFHNSCRDKTVTKVLDDLGARSRPSDFIKARSEQSPEGFSFKSLAEVMDEPDVEQEWLVDQILIQGGTSILTGRPKSGKTTLARYLAYCVAHGTRWLNLPTQQGTVLFIALEDKISQLKQIFQKLQITKDAPIFFHVGRPPSIPLPSLKQEIIERRAALVIIDTMLKFQHIEDVNNYSETNKFLYDLASIAKETNCHILILHHSGKGGETSDSDDERSLLGSTAISGGADTLIFVTQRNRIRYFSTVQRYGNSIERKVLVLDSGTGGISLHEIGTFRTTETTEKILNLLKDGPQERQFLATSLQMKGQDFTDILRDMVSQGMIRFRTEGRKHIYEGVVQIDSAPKKEGGKQ